ncbi:hypothetical protein EDB19DRAFT_1840771 [Suillus lakei]|nr:hypothetical protein EDB19DRAFT_1840771 [Suillus lakei]
MPLSPFLHRADSIYIVLHSVRRSPTKSSSPIPTQAQSDQHDTLEWKVLDEPMVPATNTLNIPNYTDSVGFGQTHTQKLLVHCGSMEVEDVVAGVELVRRGVSEEGRQVVMGGVMEVIGQHPTLFNVASLRNPVISPGEMAKGTDTPDWVYSEFWIPSTFDFDFLTSPASGSLVPPAPDSLTPTPSQMTPTPTIPPPTTSIIVSHNLPNRLHCIPNRARPRCNRASADIDRQGWFEARGCIPAKELGETSTGSGTGNENETRGGNGNGKDGNGKERKDGIVEILFFAGETHSIEGVEVVRVCLEAMRDWFKVFAEVNLNSTNSKDLYNQSITLVFKMSLNGQQRCKNAVWIESIISDSANSYVSPLYLTVPPRLASEGGHKQCLPSENFSPG